MPYDFTSLMDRRGWDAIAVEGLGSPSAPAAPREEFDPIPMWVADMNFPTCPAILEAIARRAAHPAFGYFSPSPAYYGAICSWQARRNGVSGLEEKHIGYENGVLGGVVSALGVLCSRGDKVLLHSPTYIGFTHALTDNGYQPVLSPLVQDGGGVWRMDFDDLERKMTEHALHAAILCSPHNPCGRVWEDWELERFMALCKKHDVFVISDEIWSDLTLPGFRHIPTQSVSPDARERTVALYAPSKTFNLAGLIGSYHIIYNPWLRDRVARQSALTYYNSMNVLSMHALVGAYSPQGEAWLEELRQVLAGNIDYVLSFLASRLPGIEAARPQGTYMLFLDCSAWAKEHGKTIGEIERACWDVGVAVQDGRMFHGQNHLRMNVALPRSRVEEAMARLERYVFSW